MELGNKLLTLRKKQGFSQEKIAEVLGVSRQTISKWELGETAPDISQAKAIAKLFSVSLDELLDNDITNILTTRISNTEKLAGMIMRILKISGLVLAILILVVPLYIVFFNSSYAWFIGNSYIYCTLDDEVYEYEIELETIFNKVNRLNDIEIKQSKKIADIKRAEGSAYLSNIIELEKYEYYYQLEDAVYGYFAKQGGNCN